MTLTISTLFINGQNLSVELASTSDQKAQGLSHRLNLPLGHGMLFLFENDYPRSFHMVGMQFPLDILWINSRGLVVGITEDAQPTPETAVGIPPLYASPFPCKYVIELNAGEVKELGISVGDHVDGIPRDTAIVIIQKSKETDLDNLKQKRGRNLSYLEGLMDGASSDEEQDDKLIFLRRNNLSALNKWLEAYETYPNRVPKNVLDKMGTLRRVWVKKQDGGGFAGGTVATSGDAGFFTPTFGGNGKKKKSKTDLLKEYVTQIPGQVFGATVCNECEEDCACGIYCECLHDCICPDLYIGQNGQDLILNIEWIRQQSCDGPVIEKSMLEKQGNVITTPTGKDGKFSGDKVPSGSSVWITVTNPQSPLSGRAIMITKRPDGLFALTGGAGQKSGEVEARRHMVLTGTPKKTKRDLELEEKISDAKKHNEPLLAARKEISAEARRDVRKAADSMLGSLGLQDAKAAELRQKRDDIQNHVETLLGEDKKSEAKRITDVIMRNAIKSERTVSQNASTRRQQVVTRIGRRLKGWNNENPVEGATEDPTIDEVLERIPDEELEAIVEEEEAGPGMSSAPPPILNIPLPDVEALQDLTPQQQEAAINRHFDNATGTFNEEGRETDENQPQDDIPHIEIGETVQNSLDLQDREQLGEAISGVQSYWDRRHEVEELTSALKKIPLTQVNPSTLSNLRDSIQAANIPLSLEEIEGKMSDEYNHHMRNASALRLYDVIGDFWNDDISLAEQLLSGDTKDTVMKAHMDGGAATALAAIAKEHLGLRIDAKRLIESGNVELACYALAYEMRQKYNNPQEYQKILDTMRDFNSENQRQTEVNTLDRHDQLSKQNDEINRQREAGELVDQVKIDTLQADNLIERRKNLGNALGSLQTSATVFDALSKFQTAKSSTVGINVGSNPDDLQAMKERLRLDGRAVQRYSEDVSDPGNLTLNVDVGALGRFVSFEKDIQTMTDKYEKIKTDDSNVVEDDDGNMNVEGHEVPFWNNTFTDESGNERDYSWRVEQRNDMNWLLETSKKTADNPTGEGGGLITRTTGAGKTNTALGFFAHKISENPNYKALVAVPKGRSAQWADEANRFMQTGEGLNIVHIPDGTAKAEVEDILSKSKGGTIYIMGHQEISKVHETLSAIQTADELKEHRFDGLTLDEPQELQARGGSGKIGAVGQRIMRIPMNHRIGLTATPARTNPTEAYDLIKWTSGAKDIGSRTTFQRTFGGFGSGTNAQDTAISKMYFDTIRPYISGDRLTTPTFQTTHNKVDVRRTEVQVQRQKGIEAGSKESLDARQKEIISLVRNETLTNPDGSRHPDASLVRSLRRSANWENLLPRAATRVARREHEQLHTENMDSHPEGTSYSENAKVQALADGISGNKDQKHVIYIDSRTQRNSINSMLEELGYTKSEIKNIASSTTDIKGREMGERARAFRKDPRTRIILIDKTSSSGYNLQSGDQLHVMGSPVDGANYLQAQGRIARMPRVGDIAINTYRYEDNPTEQAHWNDIDAQLKILRASSPALFSGV